MINKHKLVSKALSSIIGEKIIDAQTGFRAFSNDALAKLHIFSEYTNWIKNDKNKNISFNIILLYK